MSIHNIAKQLNMLQSDEPKIIDMREKMINWLIYEPNMLYARLDYFNGLLRTYGLKEIERY